MTCPRLILPFFSHSPDITEPLLRARHCSGYLGYNIESSGHLSLPSEADCPGAGERGVKQ